MDPTALPPRPPWLLRAATSVALLLVVGPAYGADPPAPAPTPTTTTTTTSDCVAASHASPTSQGKRQGLRAERAQLLICASESCPEDIRQDCTRRAQQVSAQIPTVIVDAKDSSGATLTAVKVTMDGEVLAERLDGTALSVDPGEHTFTFEAAGQPLLTKMLMIQQAQKDHREAITFDKPVGWVDPATLPRPTVPTQEKSQGTDWEKTTALIGAGVAVVSVGVGTVYGVLALSKKSTAQGVCPGSTVCPTQQGVNDWSSAQSAATVSSFMFALASLAALEAAVFWFAPGMSSPTQTQVGLGPGALQVKGSW
jgi:hypothetical protein